MSPLPSERLSTFRRVLRGELSTSQAGLLLGLSESEVGTCCALLREEATHRRRSTLRRGLALAGLLVAAGGLVGGPALAQTCTSNVPAPLKTFCPGSPAVASDVNFNFEKVGKALIAKTGSLDSLTSLSTSLPISTTSTLSVGGAASAASLSANSLSVSGTVVAGALQTRTVSAIPTDSVSFSGIGDIPGLTASVTLTTPATVVVEYAVSLVATGPVGYLVTKLHQTSSPAREFTEARSAVGNTTYFNNAGRTIVQLPAGTHTFKVSQRTSTTVQHDPSSDYQMRMLRIHVLGN